MVKTTPFPKRSDLSREELQRIANDLRKASPAIFEALSHPDVTDGEVYERSTAGLFDYLRSYEESVKGQNSGPISKMHLDLINFLAGRFDDLQDWANQ